MKKIWKLLMRAFTFLALTEVVFVIRSGGHVSSAYACVPMIAALGCYAMYRAEKAKEEQ